MLAFYNTQESFECHIQKYIHEKFKESKLLLMKSQSKQPGKKWMKRSFVWQLEQIVEMHKMRRTSMIQSQWTSFPAVSIETLR
jgi:hypothetical protein